MPTYWSEYQFASTLKPDTNPYLPHTNPPSRSSIARIAAIDSPGVKGIDAMDAYGATVPSWLLSTRRTACSQPGRHTLKCPRCPFRRWSS